MRIAFVLAACALLASCDTEKKPLVTPTPPPAAPPAAPPPGAAPATPKTTLPDLKAFGDSAVEKAKAAQDAATAETRKATAAIEEKATEVGSSAKDVAEDLPEAARVLDSSFSLEQLKTLVGSLSTDKLTLLADKIAAALKGTSLESTAALVTQLKEKLTLVVDKLKTSGIDVSKYTALLGR